MSAKIAPENVSIGVTLASRAAPKPAPISRPIEDAGAMAADSNSKRNRAFGRSVLDGTKAEPGTRPPGKDPSVLPQSLFDAALIAAEYKPQTQPAQSPKDTSEPPASAPADQAAAARTDQKQAEETLASALSDKPETAPADDRQSPPPEPQSPPQYQATA